MEGAPQAESLEDMARRIRSKYPTREDIVSDYRNGTVSEEEMVAGFPEEDDQNWIKTQAGAGNKSEGFTP